MAIGETVITIVGNLTADPELRTTGQGAQAAGANGRNSRRRHSNPPSRRPMIRGALRRTTSHHSEVSANPIRNRNSKEQQ